MSGVVAKSSAGDLAGYDPVRGDVVGETLFYGRGAGQDATSSAVIADIAEAVLFLLGDRARHVAGATLSVDGGEAL